MDAGVIGAPGSTGCKGVGNGADAPEDDVAVVVDLNTSAVWSLSLFVGLLGKEEVNGRVIVTGRCTCARPNTVLASIGLGGANTGVLPP